MLRWRERIASVAPIAASLVLHAGAIALLIGTSSPIPVADESIPVVSVRLFSNRPAAKPAPLVAQPVPVPVAPEAPRLPEPPVTAPTPPPAPKPQLETTPRIQQKRPVPEARPESQPVEVAATPPVSAPPPEPTVAPDTASRSTPDTAPRTAPAEEVTAVDSDATRHPSSNPAEIAPTPGADYAASVRARILTKRRYPSIARRRTIEGRVSVWIQIGRDGSVIGLDFVSDAPKILETATSRAIGHAAPFPPPPGGPVTVEIDLDYRLRDSST